MKKIIYISAAILSAACSKTDISKNNSSNDSVSFEKGQEVTLTVNAGLNSRVSGQLNDSNGVSFKWEEGDAIKVTVKESSSQFVVSELIDDGAYAKFTGVMPDAGSTFDVQFPYDTPDITTQEYVEGGIPHNMMLATATGCAIGRSFSLSPQYAALRLNFYGLDREITQINVTNTTVIPNVTYTLNCDEAVKVGSEKSTATPFLVIIPDGTYAFDVEIDANVLSESQRPDYLTYGKGIDITKRYFSSTSEKVFSKGVINNMPARRITTIWAPLNCGTDANHPWGLLYQWGRKDGQGYYHNTYSPNETTPTIENVFEGTNGVYTGTNPLSATTFYMSGGRTEMTFDYDWIRNGSNKYWNKAESPNDAIQTGEIFPEKGDFDPCPDGWRVPTYYELYLLIGRIHSSAGLEIGNHGTLTNVNGKYYNGTYDCNSSTTGPKVFLPAAGFRRDWDTHSGTPCDADCRNENCRYWSSSVRLEYASCLRYAYGAGGTGMDTQSRGMGFSIRCVYCEE